MNTLGIYSNLKIKSSLLYLEIVVCIVLLLYLILIFISDMINL